MRRILAPAFADCAAGSRLPVLLLVAVLAAPGCRHEPAIEFIGAAKPPTVQLLQPQVRKIVRVVGQPSFIESYERTSIYAKPSAYILKWIVDIGDKVKKGDVLATLFAPELVEELGTKKANVGLDQERIALAKEVVEVAAAEVKAADAQLKETEAILAKFQSEVDRWDQEVKRLERQVSQVVVNSGARQGKGDHQEGEGGFGCRRSQTCKGQGGRKGHGS
jgi:HlyD family secretion protein